MGTWGPGSQPTLNPASVNTIPWSAETSLLSTALCDLF